MIDVSDEPAALLFEVRKLIIFDLQVCQDQCILHYQHASGMQLSSNMRCRFDHYCVCVPLLVANFWYQFRSGDYLSYCGVRGCYAEKSRCLLKMIKHACYMVGRIQHSSIEGFLVVAF